MKPPARIKCLRERRREAEEAAAKQRRRSSEGSSTTPRWQRLHEEHKEISSRKAALEEEGRRATDEEAKALLHQVMPHGKLPAEEVDRITERLYTASLAERGRRRDQEKKQHEARMARTCCFVPNAGKPVSPVPETFRGVALYENYMRKVIRRAAAEKSEAAANADRNMKPKPFIRSTVYIPGVSPSPTSATATAESAGLDQADQISPQLAALAAETAEKLAAQKRARSEYVEKLFKWGSEREARLSRLRKEKEEKLEAELKATSVHAGADPSRTEPNRHERLYEDHYSRRKRQEEAWAKSLQEFLKAPPAGASDNSSRLYRDAVRRKANLQRRIQQQQQLEEEELRAQSIHADAQRSWNRQREEKALERLLHAQTSRTFSPPARLREQGSLPATPRALSEPGRPSKAATTPRRSPSPSHATGPGSSTSTQSTSVSGELHKQKQPRTVRTIRIPAVARLDSGAANRTGDTSPAASTVRKQGSVSGRVESVSPAPFRETDSRNETGFGTGLGRRRSSTPSFETRTTFLRSLFAAWKGILARGPSQASMPRDVSRRARTPGSFQTPQAKQAQGSATPKACPKPSSEPSRATPSTPRTTPKTSPGETPKGSPRVVQRITRRDTLERQSPAKPRQRSATPSLATRSRPATPFRR